jgi:electron transfer flavoprotein beta subunit
MTTPADLGVSMTNTQTLLKVVPPADRKAGIKVASVAELVEKLKTEAKVL